MIPKAEEMCDVQERDGSCEVGTGQGPTPWKEWDDGDEDDEDDNNNNSSVGL